MPKKKKGNKNIKVRAEPNKTTTWLCSPEAYDTLTCKGYTSLSHCPEIITGVETIARLVGAMTIHLMENTEDGDIRIKNELSRKIDIEPNDTMTRSTFIQWIVRTMFLDGDGNAVVYPRTQRGLLRELRPIPSALTSFVPDGFWNYKIMISGTEYSPKDVLHFVMNPDNYYPWKGTGLRISLNDVANSLKQATETEKGFMSSKWKPSLIVKVDALIDEFSSPDGRKELLNQYVESAGAGEPWLIPADQFSVEQVRPLTLSDLAIDSVVTLNKKTVAAVLGIPAFALGVGNFSRDEWNNFIQSRIMPLAQMIEQELTKKLLISPNWFFRFNPRSLYNYNIHDLSVVAKEQYSTGLMTGNEARDWIGMDPLPGLNDLVMLENYIPADRIGDQKKLSGGGESNATEID